MKISDAFSSLVSIEPFLGMTESDLKSFEKELDLHFLNKDEILFQQGETGDRMYVLLEGQLGVQLVETDGTVIELDELDPVVCVGEMALLTGQPRAATVYALRQARLVSITKTGFERLAREDPQRVCDFAEKIAHRMQRTKLAGILTQVFGSLEPAALHELHAELVWQQVSAGEHLFHQGDPGDSMLILVSGRLRLSMISLQGETSFLADIEPGEIVGEFALLTEEPRSASLIAIRDSSLVLLSRPAFENLLEKYPGAMMQITRLLIQRQKRVIQPSLRATSRAQCVALVAIDPELRLPPLAEDLTNVLAENASVRLLDRHSFDRDYGMPGAAQITVEDPTYPILAGWMDQLELDYQHILYVADPNWTPWTQRCVRQADRVLLVCLSSSDPGPWPIEQDLRTTCNPSYLELVLLHPEGTDFPSGTSPWLIHREVAAHHHIRQGDRSHLQRLARHLTGTSIGLVLSGGSARGFAHLGVMRAMDELGIHADRVGGTSMGALIGAGYAVGLSNEEVVQKCRVYANPKTLFDYTLPLSSLMTSKKLTRAVKIWCEDYQIEDFWHPFFCVSVNLTRAEPVIHQSGPLWKCLRTSIAIPGVFSPIQHNGDVLVDGGLMNNFPVDLMDGFWGAGPIIGVNVSRRDQMRKTYECGTSINGWKVLWSRINPFIPRVKVPSLLGTLMRSMEVNAVYQRNTSGAKPDILIQPEVDQFASLDFTAFEPIIEAGYQSALPQLREWLDHRVPLSEDRAAVRTG